MMSPLFRGLIVKLKLKSKLIKIGTKLWENMY